MVFEALLTLLGVFSFLGYMLYAIRATAFEARHGHVSNVFLIVMGLIMLVIILSLYFLPEILAGH